MYLLLYWKQKDYDVFISCLYQNKGHKTSLGRPLNLDILFLTVLWKILSSLDFINVQTLLLRSTQVLHPILTSMPNPFGSISVEEIWLKIPFVCSSSHSRICVPLIFDRGHCASSWMAQIMVVYTLNRFSSVFSERRWYS